MIVTEDSLPSLEAILNYSIFNCEKDLLSQFDAIPGKKGTRVLIWNIRRYSITRILNSHEQMKYDKVHFHIISFVKELLIYFMNMGTLQLSSDTPEEGIRSHYRWL
jgi:hypothetical protein